MQFPHLYSPILSHAHGFEYGHTFPDPSFHTHYLSYTMTHMSSNVFIYLNIQSHTWLHMYAFIPALAQSHLLSHKLTHFNSHIYMHVNPPLDHTHSHTGILYLILFSHTTTKPSCICTRLWVHTYCWSSSYICGLTVWLAVIQSLSITYELP